eukprot:GSChrysophyteH1.ASY1.ANO1.120.1 assembled CDS
MRGNLIWPGDKRASYHTYFRIFFTNCWLIVNFHKKLVHKLLNTFYFHFLSRHFRLHLERPHSSLLNTIMVKAVDRPTQKKLVNEMLELVGIGNRMDPLQQGWTVRSASRRVSGEDGHMEVRQHPDAIVRISSKIIINIWKTYTEFGCLPIDLPERYKRDRNRNGRTTWEEQDVRTLLNLINTQPTLFLDEMLDYMQSNVPERSERFSIKSIRHVLKMKKYTRKIIYEKAAQASTRERNAFIRNLHDSVSNIEQVLFLDESNKDRVAEKRKRGWGIIGNHTSYREPFNRNVRYTFFGAADCHGFVGHCCDFQLHSVDQKETGKPVDAERYVQYFREKVYPYIGNFDLQEKHSIIVMDNCTVHMDPAIEQMIRERGGKIIYSAPYSPDLIPIEFMFGKWKSYLKRNQAAFNRDWYTTHIESLSCVTKIEGLHYFSKTTLVELAVEAEQAILDEEHRKKERRKQLFQLATLLCTTDGLV